MDNFIYALLALGIGVGGLLLSRNAGASTGVQNVTDPTEENFTPASGVRGIRNNNPFNLEYRNIGWRGELGPEDHPSGRFSKFDTPLNGIRAGMINIHTKIFRDRANTVRKLINVLSPKFENPTDAFVNFVAKRVGVAPDQPLDYRAHIRPLSKAIITFENGSNPYSDELITAALQATGKV